MKTRPLGDSDVAVAEIGFRVRGSTARTAELMRVALEEGVNYFQVESGERATMLRRTLGELRHHVVLGASCAPGGIRATCDALLARLDKAELGVLWVKPASVDESELERALASAQSLQVSGRVRTYGFAVSHLSAAEQVAIGQWAIETAGAPFVQISYSLHEPHAGKQLFELASESQTSFMVVLPKVTTMLDTLLGEELAHAVSTIARKSRQLRFLSESGRSLAQSAIKFALAQPSVVCVLPALHSLTELRLSIAATDAPDLTRAELNRLDDLAEHGFHLKPAEPPGV